MATKGERKALLFLAAVALLGAGTRACRVRHDAGPTGDLDRQIGAVESSSARGHKSGRAAPARERSRVTRVDRAGDSVGVPLAIGLGQSEANPPRTRLDLDVAPAADIERLPGIGAAIAKRIVSDRETKGAFGCLAGLDAVKGIGPALLARLDSLVTFSGPPRGTCGQR
jgi:competence protein ComEA